MASVALDANSTDIGGLTMDIEPTDSDTKSEKWMVAYAKILLDKDNGVKLHDIYFGGVGDSQEEAARIAKECVNTIKGGTILPRVFKLDEGLTIIDMLYEAADKFEVIAKRMQEAEVILNRSKKK